MIIDISEGIDTNKTSVSKECILCHYIFVSNICNKCHDVLMTAYELKKHSHTKCNYLRILFIYNYVDYKRILLGISRNEAVNILNNSVLEDKGVL